MVLIQTLWIIRALEQCCPRPLARSPEGQSKNILRGRGDTPHSGPEASAHCTLPQHKRSPHLSCLLPSSFPVVKSLIIAVAPGVGNLA